jgi:biopolymer transport protein ExbD
MAPLIDMALLLIVFFVLVSQLGASDRVPMRLPQPTPSAAMPPGRESRGVVNVMVRDGRIDGWRFAGQDFGPDADGLQAVAEAVAAAVRTQPTMELHLRADAGLPYADVAPAIDVIGRAAVRAAGGKPVRFRVAVQPGGDA